VHRPVARACLVWLALCALLPERSRAAEAQGSELDAAGLEASRDVDPRGLSLLVQARRRSPSGLLYPYPFQPPAWRTAGALETRGFAELGYLGSFEPSGHEETRYEEYVDWSDGLLLRDFFLDARTAQGAGYASFEGGSVGRDDAFYRGELGRRGWLKLGLFYDEVPHVLANDARSIYPDIGSERLTLPPPLTPNGSTPAQIQAVLDTVGERTLDIQRSRAGTTLGFRATPELSLTGHYRRERRTGERPFGGAIFFSFPPAGAAAGSVIETVEPVDALTHDFGTGLQYAGKRVQANLAYRGSTFENQRDALVWENPFTMAGTPVPEGRIALAPDNSAHGLHGDIGVNLPGQARWTASAAFNRMRQREGLFPPTIHPGLPDWNTQAALRDDEADALVETWLLDSSLRLRPLRRLTARLHLRWFERNDHTDWDAYNPLADAYGYVAEDNPRFAPNPALGFIPRYAPVPFDHSRLLGEASAVWRMPMGANLELEYGHEEFDRSHRSRDTREDTGRVSVTSRRLGPASVRLAYEIRDRSGGGYDVEHDALYYSQGPLQDFAPAPLGTPLQSLRDFRQFDLASRVQQEGQARVHLALGSAVDLALAGLLRGANYDSDYGRDFERGRELNVELGWQPSPKLDLNAFGSVERRAARLRTIDAQSPTPPFDAGGPAFPFSNRWSAESDGATLSFGSGFRARPLPRLELSGDYTWLRSREELDYAYASAAALAGNTTPQQAGDDLPRLITSDQVLRLAAELRLSERWSGRLFWRFEHSRLEDPQQRGLVPLIRRALYLAHVDDDFEATVAGVALSLRF
jgi:MtrB/PioB family decaheme-associated outer membrane protein